MTEKQKTWLQCTLIRVVRQMAWTAIGVIGGAQLWEEVNWHVVLSAIAISALVNFCACIIGIPEVDLITEDIPEAIEAEEEDPE